MESALETSTTRTSWRSSRAWLEGRLTSCCGLGGTDGQRWPHDTVGAHPHTCESRLRPVRGFDAKNSRSGRQCIGLINRNRGSPTESAPQELQTPNTQVWSFQASLSDSARNGTSSIDEPGFNTRSSTFRPRSSATGSLASRVDAQREGEQAATVVLRAAEAGRVSIAKTGSLMSDAQAVKPDIGRQTPTSGGSSQSPWCIKLSPDFKTLTASVNGVDWTLDPGSWSPEHGRSGACLIKHANHRYRMN